jgi:heptosyltransferase-2
MENPKKILIVRNDHIGDFVLSTAVFRELKKKYPKSKIVLITSKVNRVLAEKDKNIGEIWELEIPQYNLKTIWRYLKMALKIRKEKFDVGIDLRGSLLISSLLLWLGNVKKRIGKCDNYHNEKMNKIISFFQTNPIKTEYYSNKRHITKENLYIINKGLGINLKNNLPKIVTDSQDEKEVKEFIKNNNLRDYICIFPLTDSPSKQWPIKNFEEIIRWTKNNFNGNVLLIGTEAHRKELERLSNFNSKSKVVANFNIRLLSLLFNKSQLVLAHDGGPFHIAWSSGARTVELVRPFPPELAAGKFRALKSTKIIWSKNEDIKNISLEDVTKAMSEFLDKK